MAPAIEGAALAGRPATGGTPAATQGPPPAAGAPAGGTATALADTLAPGNSTAAAVSALVRA
ncbi:hypothetical protein, partial [Nocardia asiatica]|uniref:hypothetical protein n=1 Tax=Nocardia asiatica TaxID=209252 RepID=UPI003CC7CFAE